MIIEFLKKIRNWCVVYKNKKFMEVGHGFSCGRGTFFFARNSIIIGNNVYFGRYCNIECDAVIGNDVLIANNVGFVGRLDHDYRKAGVPVRFSPSVRDPNYRVPQDKRQITVGDDVWIGYGATVLSGVSIGEGAIVAAGSLVAKDVEPFSVVAGIPAKKNGMRFSTREIEEHKALCKKSYSSYNVRKS